MPVPDETDRVRRVPGPAIVAQPPRGSSAVLRRLADALAAVVVLGVFWLPPTLEHQGWRLAAGLSLAALVGAAMLTRERLPAVLVGGVGVATLVAAALGLTDDFMLAAAWCLYPLAVRRATSARRLVVGLVVTLLLVSVTVGFPDDARQAAQWAILSVVAPGVAWLLGTAVGRQLDAARDAARAATRLEVAREVHDVVGHALGLLSAQAGVARSLPDATDAELREALAEIEQRARHTLTEVQELVGTLRAADPDESDDVALAPQLHELVARTRAAGVQVDERVSLDEPLRDATALVVFRIVQESLANAVRHAPGAPCTVVVESVGNDVRVQVRDHGPGARQRGPGVSRVEGAGVGPGFGLTGMRERAHLVGGTVQWGNHPEGGFEVSALLPARARGEVSTSG